MRGIIIVLRNFSTHDYDIDSLAWSSQKNLPQMNERIYLHKIRVAPIIMFVNKYLGDNLDFI